jgi:hypothetical protein
MFSPAAVRVIRSIGPVCEGSMPLDASAGMDDVRFGSLFDSLLELGVRMGEDPVRTLRVVKARGIAHDLRVHRMTIGEGGIRVEGPLEWR